MTAHVRMYGLPWWVFALSDCFVVVIARGYRQYKVSDKGTLYLRTYIVYINAVLSTDLLNVPLREVFVHDRRVTGNT